MTTQTKNPTQQNQRINNGENSMDLSKLKRFTFALLIDTLLWAYIILSCYKVIYEKAILQLDTTDFSWSQPLLAMGIGTVVSIILFFTKASIGKATQGLYYKEGQ